MRVLLLRPMRDSARSAALLAAHGHETIVSPLFDIAPRQAPAPKSAPDALVATSANAFICLPKAFESLRALPLFVVGERTLAAARANNFNSTAFVGADVAALLGAFLERPIRGERLLYLAGATRKPDLEDGLSQAGYRFEVAVVYETRIRRALSDAAQGALREGAVDAVLHYSPRSAALFRDCVIRAGLENAATKLIHVAISQDTAQPLQGLAGDLRIAASKNERSLFAALV